ncbi:MAG: DHH family phosphoesterase [Halobacteriaceae archaeon]
MTDSPAGDAPTGTEPPVVYRLEPDCTVTDISAGEHFHATVNGVVDYGVFVDLSEHLSGLIHESDLDTDYDVGDDLVVTLEEIKANGDLSFVPATFADYETRDRRHEYDRTGAGALADAIGTTVHLEGEVAQIKQTGGPTLFRVRDETGVVQCAAFEAAGVRAYPDIAVGDVVHVVGDVEERDGVVQVEVADIDRLDGGRGDAVRDRLAAGLIDAAAPADPDPLVEWPAFEKLRPGLERVARRLREAVLESRPIRIRHHADGDGMCAAVPVELALRRFIEDTHADPDAAQHLLRRLPSKAPYYELEDVTRDLDFALEDEARHGQQLPLVLMLDNGSTEEDIPAYETLSHYDVPILVVDHHHPDPDAVNPLVDEHVNPYLVDEDYRITTGMLSVELARMIAPDLTPELEHVPAIAGIADRSKANAMSDYLDLARQAGYDEVFLEDTSEALDVVAHHLRYNPGTYLVNDVLNVGGDPDRHRELVPLLAQRGREEARAQLEAADPHVDRRMAANGAHLCLIDLENHAYRFTYPAPGKTTGELHDSVVEDTGDPVITIGYGPDFAVLRSDGVRLDIPEIIDAINDELPGAGVSGGGHLVVGSIKFVPGMREPVLDALVEKMGDAEIDEALQAARRT